MGLPRLPDCNETARRTEFGRELKRKRRRKKKKDERQASADRKSGKGDADAPSVFLLLLFAWTRNNVDAFSAGAPVTRQRQRVGEGGRGAEA